MTHLPPNDDTALVDRARHSDRAAFEELVRRSARLVYARIYLETADAHRSEDLVQETFLLAWRSIDELVDSRDFRGWLNAIAHRVVVDAARRDLRKKRKAGGKQATLDAVEDRAVGPDESALRREERDRVLSILRSMPEEYRVPLMLRYLAGADYDTIARQLALSNGSLRGLLNRGMKMLRERMSN